jgi:hypothetical protein
VSDLLAPLEANLMAAATGTLEQLALAVARALQPLAFRLSDGTVMRLGVEFPVDLLTHPAISGPRTIAAQAAEDVSPLVHELRQAIADEDAAAVTVASVALVAHLAVTLSALDALARSLCDHGADLPGIMPAQINAFASDLPRKLLDLVLVEALDDYQPVMSALLTFVGIVERTAVEGDPSDPTRPEYEAVAVHLDRAPRLLADPALYLSDHLDWGAPGFDGGPLLAAMHAALGLVSFPSQLLPATGTDPARLDSLTFECAPPRPGSTPRASRSMRSTPSTARSARPMMASCGGRRPLGPSAATSTRPV